MKLTATVIETISGSNYDDKQPRVKLKVAEADSCFRTFIAPNGEGWALDDELVLLVLTKEQATELSKEFERESGEVSKWYPGMAALADQLRPDEPPIDGGRAATSNG